MELPLIRRLQVTTIYIELVAANANEGDRDVMLWYQESEVNQNGYQIHKKQLE